MMPRRWTSLRPHDGTLEDSVEALLPAPLPCEWLYDASSESVLIVNAATHAITHANPSAAGLVGIPELIGKELLSAFEDSSLPMLRDCLSAAAECGSASTGSIRARGGAVDLKAEVALVRSASEVYLLVKLSPDGAHRESSDRHGAASPVFDAIDAAPVAFVLTDSALNIDYANRAFVDLVGVESAAAARGKPLTRWLGLSHTDLSRLQDDLTRREAATLLTPLLRSAGGMPHRVELHAVPVPEGDAVCWGFSVRTLPRPN